MRVSDTGACQGTWAGDLLSLNAETPQLSPPNIEITVDDTGSIIYLSGMAGPASGNMFCEDDEMVAFMHTGEADENAVYNQISLKGNLTQGIIAGNYFVDNSGTNDPDGSFSFTLPDLCLSQTAVPIAECSALIDFYNNTDGDSWTDNTKWKQDADVCSWYGITCADGHVTQIDLFGNNLSGIIPESIGDLTGLQEVYLTNNTLTGSLPESIGELINLTSLIISYNSFSGSIPDSIGQLTNLTEINLGNNQLSGTIPSSIGNLSSLTILKMYNNQLTGSIPESLYGLTSLTNLVLHGNQLSGTFSEAIGNLVNLVELRLSDNPISGAIPSSIGNLTQLGLPPFGGLSLTGMQLCGEIPASITNLTNLAQNGYSLQIDNNDLYSNDQTVQDFLALVAGDWESTQIDICE